MPTATINTANQRPIVGERERDKEERESERDIYVWRCGWPVASTVCVCVCVCVFVSVRYLIIIRVRLCMISADVYHVM